MPSYRRWHVGGAFFFTVVTHERRPIFASESARRMLRAAIGQAQGRLSFELPAIVLLPDHIHMIMRLPEGDGDFSRRISAMKRNFTEAYLRAEGSEGKPTPGRTRQRYRGVWQKRFYEHAIRDYRDFKRHLDYIHVNPVKHGLAEWPRDWPWSSFHRYVNRGEYDEQWCGHVDLAGVDIEPDDW